MKINTTISSIDHIKIIINLYLSKIVVHTKYKIFFLFCLKSIYFLSKSMLYTYIRKYISRSKKNEKSP